MNKMYACAFALLLAVCEAAPMQQQASQPTSNAWSKTRMCTVLPAITALCLANGLIDKCLLMPAATRFFARIPFFAQHTGIAEWCTLIVPGAIQTLIISALVINPICRHLATKPAILREDRTRMAYFEGIAKTALTFFAIKTIASTFHFIKATPPRWLKGLGIAGCAIASVSLPLFIEQE